MKPSAMIAKRSADRRKEDIASIAIMTIFSFRALCLRLLICRYAIALGAYLERAHAMPRCLLSACLRRSPRFATYWHLHLTFPVPPSQRPPVNASLDLVGRGCICEPQNVAKAACHSRREFTGHCLSSFAIGFVCPRSIFFISWCPIARATCLNAKNGIREKKMINATITRPNKPPPPNDGMLDVIGSPRNAATTSRSTT